MDVAATSEPHPPWHAELWQRMARGLASDRVAHGLLICGAPGVGKRAFVQRLVQALLCREPRLNRDACGQCSGCRQYLAGTHPDISRLMPDEPGRAIKVEQVRAFGHALHLTSQYATGRVGWIDPAEQLSISAANSLLKTLEEPPAGCHIVLVTDRVSALMATIRSRCQLWRVPPAEAEAARAWLDARSVSTEGLERDLLRAPFAAVARQQEGYADKQKVWDEDLARLLCRRVNPVSIAERAAAEPAELWADWLYRRANRLLASSLSADGTAILPEPLREAAARIGPTVFEPWCRQVADAARLRRTNADWRLVIESVLVDLSQRLP